MEDNKGIMPLQDKKTVTKYAGIISAFIWYLIVQSENPVDNRLQIYASQKESIMELKDILSTLPSDTDPLLNDPISSRISNILCLMFQLYV